jgi:hypothetical protein
VEYISEDKDKEHSGKEEDYGWSSGKDKNLDPRRDRDPESGRRKKRTIACPCHG